MAARWLQNRLIPLLSSRGGQLSPILREHPHIPSANVATFNIHEYLRRTIQTNSEPAEEIQTKLEPINCKTEEIRKDEACSSKVNSFTGEVVAEPKADSYSAIKCSATSSLKFSSRHDLAMIFTCTVCETRSVKTVCRESYDKGVVVVRCGGCENLHLIADRLGWFGETGSIEDILAARGEQVKKGSIDTVDLTLEDLAGKKI